MTVVAVHAYLRIPITAQAVMTGVASDLGGLTASREAAWARAEGEVIKIDPASDTVVARVAAPGFGGLDADGSDVYVASFDDNVVERIDAATASITATIGVGLNPEGVDVTADTVWVANHRGGSVTRVDRRSNAVTVRAGWKRLGRRAEHHERRTARHGDQRDRLDGRRLPLTPLRRPRARPRRRLGPAVVDGAFWFPVWNAGSGVGRLVRSDPGKNDVTAIAELGAGFRFRGTVAAFGSLWLSTADGRVVRLPLSALTS